MAIRESEVLCSVEGLSIGHGVMGSPRRRFQSGRPKGDAGTVLEKEQSSHQHYHWTERHLPCFGKYYFLRCLLSIILLSGDLPIRLIWMLVLRLRHGFSPHALMRYLSSFFYRVISRYGIHLCCYLLCLL